MIAAWQRKRQTLTQHRRYPFPGETNLIRACEAAPKGGPRRGSRASAVRAALTLLAIMILPATGAGMDRLQTVIDDVAGWDETESGADSILRLHGGLALKAARDDTRYEAWRYAAQRRVPVYVQFDPATTLIAALFMGERQLVNSIEAPSNGKAIVTFERAPSFYYVNGNQAGAAEMIARLSDAATRHEPVLVISHPSTLEILAVRPVAD